jgi:hypothetical protein
MVFLRPVIIHGPQESFGVTADRYQYLRARTQEVGRQDVLDRFAPTQPTEEELKKYKKRSNDAEQQRESAARPEAEAPAAAKPDAAPNAGTD